MKRFTHVLAALALTFSGALQADKTAGDYVDDSTVQAKVKTALMTEDFAAGAGINIEMHKGIVQLGGWVDSADVRDTAGELAAAVEGVVEVDNQLQVKQGKTSAGQKLDDSVITGRVKAALTGADFGDAVSINVDTYDGVVLLTGFVHGADAKAQAGELAQGVENVAEVINGIFAYH